MEYAISIVEKYLGVGDKKKGSNYAFFCPFCPTMHKKKKLEVNLDSGKWNCWVCHTKGTSIDYLLYLLKADKEDTKYFRTKPRASTLAVGNEVEEIVRLPNNFVPFTCTETELDVKVLYNKVRERNLTDDDIRRFNLGYLDSYSIRNNIVIPSYDSKGNLNYYIQKNLRTGAYINPSISKNIIFLEFLINWSEDIILVEGFFDAVAVQRNASPLLGKILSSKWKLKIIDSESQNFYVCLDGGLQEQQDINEICGFISSVGKKAFKVKLPLGEDPSSIGKKEVWKYIRDAEPYSEDTFLNELKARW